MNRSIIVVGPQGCGKTRNGASIAKAYGLEKVVELDALPGNSTLQTEGVVYLTNEERRAQDEAYFYDLSVIPFKFTRGVK